MLAQVVGSADHKGMKENPADAWTLAEIRREFARYSELVNGSDLAPSSKTTYLQHADRFVRWLGGEVEIRPGQEAFAVVTPTAKGTSRPGSPRSHRSHRSHRRRIAHRT